MDGELKMASFRSNEEFFQAVTDLVAKLNASGHTDAAVELRQGFACLNGLTDGWALFLESIDTVNTRYSRQFAAGERDALMAVRDAVHKAVYQRRR